MDSRCGQLGDEWGAGLVWYGDYKTHCGSGVPEITGGHLEEY